MVSRASGRLTDAMMTHYALRDERQTLVSTSSTLVATTARFSHARSWSIEVYLVGHEG